MKPDLEAIRARAEKASPVWKSVPKYGDSDIFRPDIYDESSCGGGGFRRIEDEDFALHARADIPALLAYIDSLERVREAAKVLMDVPWPEIGSNYPEWPLWISKVDDMDGALAALAAAEGGNEQSNNCLYSRK